ncbi:hypothetical protein HYDPIDRAFT_110702 [Hydnomerulius pinastri MD-312]|nr:hypothetical protein HYDPIDRAFT_110702 [Hydnomerulius pinastri MD-312]
MNGGRGGNFGHGNYRDGGDYSNTGHSEATDAIVLGGDDDQTLQSSGPMEEDDQSIPNGYSSGQNELHGLNSTAGQNSGGAGGRMQRVGDKWVFVKELASGGS